MSFERDIKQRPLEDPTCVNNCPPQCENVFDRVHVSYLIRGGTRVMWELQDDFRDPLPHSYLLQVSRTGNPDADDWTDVGLPVENAFYAIDGEQRVWGKTNWTHYRVRLSTPNATYYSEPTDGIGVLERRGWRLAKDILRRERLRMRYGGIEGYLLKRRHYGPKCPTCLEFQTEEVTDPECPTCYGTGFQCGYFYPMGCIWADLSPKTKRKHIDDQGMRGTVSDIIVTGRMLMLPLIQEYDVWVNAKTDDRYYLHSIQNVAEMRGVPLVANVEMRPAPFTDIIYDVPIPQQIDAVS
jgi:hypothetical protein